LLSRDIGPFGQTFLHHGTTNQKHDQAQVENNDLSQQPPDLSSIVAIETVQVERLTHFQAPAQIARFRIVSSARRARLQNAARRSTSELFRRDWTARIQPADCGLFNFGHDWFYRLAVSARTRPTASLSDHWNEEDNRGHRQCGGTKRQINRHEICDRHLRKFPCGDRRRSTYPAKSFTSGSRSWFTRAAVNCH